MHGVLFDCCRVWRWHCAMSSVWGQGQWFPLWSPCLWRLQGKTILQYGLWIHSSLLLHYRCLMCNAITTALGMAGGGGVRFMFWCRHTLPLWCHLDYGVGKNTNIFLENSQFWRVFVSLFLFHSTIQQNSQVVKKNPRKLAAICLKHCTNPMYQSNGSQCYSSGP